MDPVAKTFNIVTEFADRGDLADLIKARRLEGGDAAGAAVGPGPLRPWSEAQVLGLFVQVRARRVHLRILIALNCKRCIVPTCTH